MILFKLSIDFGFWDFVRRRKLSERIIFRFFCSNKSENNDRNELINIMNSIFYPPKPNKSSTPKTPQSTFPLDLPFAPKSQKFLYPSPLPPLDKKKKEKTNLIDKNQYSLLTGESTFQLLKAPDTRLDGLEHKVLWLPKVLSTAFKSIFKFFVLFELYFDGISVYDYRFYEKKLKHCDRIVSSP